MSKAKKKEKSKISFLGWLRSSFLTGLLVVLPIVITFYIIKFTVTMVDNAVTSLFPLKYAPSNYLPYDIPGVELFIGILVLIVIGISVRNFIGAKLLSWGDALVHAIPGVRSIYGAVKQVIEAVSVSNSSSFREVVMIEYPRKGLWAIAFVTGETKGEVQNITKDDLVNIFLPTTPNPTSGFLLFVPRKELRPLHMTVEQGVKMVISAGIITPSTVEGYDALRKEQKSHSSESVIVNKLTKEDVATQKLEAQKRQEKEAKRKEREMAKRKVNKN